MKRLLIPILALTASAAFGQKGDGLGDNTAVVGDNIESLVETLKTNALPKSEFETTQVYEAQEPTAAVSTSTPTAFISANPSSRNLTADSTSLAFSAASVFANAC